MEFSIFTEENALRNKCWTLSDTVSINLSNKLLHFHCVWSISTWFPLG